MHVFSDTRSTLRVAIGRLTSPSCRRTADGAPLSDFVPARSEKSLVLKVGVVVVVNW